MTSTAAEQYTLELAEEHIANANGNIDKLNEVHVFNQTDVTPNAVTGQVQVYADSASGLAAVVSPAGASGQMPWTSQATQPGTVVTQASLTNLATATVTANDPVVGATYELQVWGSGTQASGARQTLQFGAAHGGVAGTNFTLGTTNWSAVSVGFRWWAIARIICITTGAGGTWQTFVFAATAEATGNLAAGNNNVGLGFQSDAGATISVDTTANKTFALQAAWGSTTGSPTMTNRQQIFRRVA